MITAAGVREVFSGLVLFCALAGLWYSIRILFERDPDRSTVVVIIAYTWILLGHVARWMLERISP